MSLKNIYILSLHIGLKGMEIISTLFNSFLTLTGLATQMSRLCSCLTRLMFLPVVVLMSLATSRVTVLTS